MNNVFGLDIGTRNVVGTVGYQTDDREFVVTAQYIREHETRAILDLIHEKWMTYSIDETQMIWVAREDL